MELTKEMLNYLKSKNIKEIVKCNDGKTINKNLNNDELLSLINELLNKTKIDFYFENGSELGITKTNETIRLYANKRRIASANDFDKFKLIVDKIYETNKIPDKINAYRNKFKIQEYRQFILKILSSLFNNKKIELLNNGIIKIQYQIENVDITKIYDFYSLENIIDNIKNGKIKEIFVS